MDWLADHETLFLFLLVLFYVATNQGILRLTSKKQWKPYSALLVALLNFLALAVLFGRVDDLRKEHANDRKVLREKHLDQLHPVLQEESNSLKYISDTARNIGYVIDPTNSPSKYAPMTQEMLWPTPLLSEDLKNHFGEYDSRKKKLEVQIELQSREALSLRNEMMGSVKPPATRKDSQDEGAVSFLRSCMDRGPGVALETTNYGYRYTFALRGPTGVEKGSPQTEFYVQSFEAFRQLSNGHQFASRCEVLKQRADWITSEAADLSGQALVYSKENTLKGECQFTIR